MKKKISFAKELYIGKSIEKKGKLNRIKSKLIHHSKFLFVYVIAVRPEGVDPIEVIKCNFLLQKYYRAYPPMVVGLASNQDEVYEIIAKITEDCILNTHSTDVRKYLLERF